MKNLIYEELVNQITIDANKEPPLLRVISGAARLWKCRWTGPPGSCLSSFIYFVLTLRRSLVVFPPLSLTCILWKCWVLAIQPHFPWVSYCFSSHFTSSFLSIHTLLLLSVNSSLLLCLLKCFCSNGADRGVHTNTREFSPGPDCGRGCRQGLSCTLCAANPTGQQPLTWKASQGEQSNSRPGVQLTCWAAGRAEPSALSPQG